MRGGRPPKKPPLSVNGLVPLSYNHRQHELNDAVRLQLGLAPQPQSAADFRNILRSLSSSLPNEVDFTLNVCGVLSAEAQSNPLTLTRAPALLSLLLAQAGIYELSSSSSAASSSSTEDSGDASDASLLVNAEQNNVKLKRNFWRFWIESTQDYPSMHDLIYEAPEDDDVDVDAPASSSLAGSKSADDVESMETDDVVEEEEEEEEKASDRKEAEASELSQMETDDSQGSSRVGLDVDDNEDDDRESEGQTRSKTARSNCAKTKTSTATASTSTIWKKLDTLIPTSAETALGCGRKGGARDLEMARVAQILVILRNLSFEEENKVVMTNDANCLRFLFLCIHSKYANLMQMGLDTMANLASKFALDECGSKTTLVSF